MLSWPLLGALFIKLSVDLIVEQNLAGSEMLLTTVSFLLASPCVRFSGILFLFTLFIHASVTLGADVIWLW